MLKIKDDHAKQTGKNKLFFFSMMALYTIAMGFCAEGYIQTYILKLGAGSQGVGIYGFLTQITFLIAYLMMTAVSPHMKNIRLKYTASAVGLSVLPLGLLLSGLFSSNNSIAFPIILCAAVIFGFVTSFKSTVEFSLLPYLFQRNQYGKISSGAAIAGGTITAVLAFFLGRNVESEPFPLGYMRLFALAVLFFILASISAACLRFLIPSGVAVQDKLSYKAILKKITTAKYINQLFPHLLRGIGMSGMYFFMTVALKNITLSDKELMLMIITGIVASICGNGIFMLLVSRIRSGILTFAANAGCSVCMIIVCFNRSNIAFFILYGIYLCFNYISQISIPTGVLRSTPDEDLPLISAMRMFVVSAVSSPLVLLFGYLLNIVPSIFVMGFSALAFTICGLIFYRRFSDSM